MRTRVLFSLAILGAATPLSASVITVGGTYAKTCAGAAEARQPDRAAWIACNTALAIEPLQDFERAGTFVNRGILYMQTGDDANALEDLAAAEQLDPDQPEIYVNRAVIAYRAGDKQQAREMASRGLALGTRKPAYAHYIRGLANEDLGAIKAAYSDLKAASELAPRWSEPKLELARYKLR
jgi:tetratricopeptide (TPR) repeat protein